MTAIVPDQNDCASGRVALGWAVDLARQPHRLAMLGFRQNGAPGRQSRGPRAREGAGDLATPDGVRGTAVTCGPARLGCGLRPPDQRWRALHAHGERRRGPHADDSGRPAPARDTVPVGGQRCTVTPAHHGFLVLGGIVAIAIVLGANLGGGPRGCTRTPGARRGRDDRGGVPGPIRHRAAAPLGFVIRQMLVDQLLGAPGRTQGLGNQSARPARVGRGRRNSRMGSAVTAWEALPHVRAQGGRNTGCLRGTPEAANIKPCRLLPGRSPSRSSRPWPRPRSATS